ncbi:metal-dependent hydrolase [Paenibacillus pini]|uniref:Membrane-bound metal-dependent hydrolase n=1 Tax=Paenibacillus pini JCM 16418 TaxID=1236976 RepID=W7YNU6_9BACL|nr:metal-dependent hydrolase [Paenibacillus pini]GAF10097.1 hypothetical protein JCM16418_4271 [Paenibacillus pini JCM 16418]
MINDILHHAFMGAALALLISPNNRKLFYYIIGAFAGLVPDVTKFIFHDQYLHSLLIVPFICIGLAFIVKLVYSSEKYIHLLLLFLLPMLAHLFMDFIDDGNLLFYPLSTTDFNYSLLNRSTPVIWVVILVISIIGIIIKKAKLMNKIALALIALFLIFQCSSKIMISKELHSDYPLVNANYYVIPASQWPWEAHTWRYMINSDLFKIDGFVENSLTRKETSFYFTPQIKLQYEVKKWEQHGNVYEILCYDLFNNNKEVTFQSKDRIVWVQK